MLRKSSLYFLLCFFVFASCSKDDDSGSITQKLIDGYFADANTLVVDFNEEDDEAYVVAFNDAHLGSNPDVFDATIPYIKNITSTGNNTWNAEILKGSYNDQNELESVTYEQTTITLGENINGDRTLTFSNADQFAEVMVEKPAGYTPPADPFEPGNPNPNDPVTCDTVSVVTTSGNSLSTTGHFPLQNAQDFSVRSVLYKPLNGSSPQSRCHYRMTGTFTHVNGSTTDIILYLSHKPTTSQSFTLSTSDWASISQLAEGTGSIDFMYYWYPATETTINVTVSGSDITATIDNVELQSHQSTWNGTPTYLTATLKGK